MRRLSPISPCALILVIFIYPLGFNASATVIGKNALTPGQVRQVLALRPLIDLPEGIAIDSHGRIFVSNSRLENDKRVPEILEIDRNGSANVFATLEPAMTNEFGTGVLGLAVNVNDVLYAALSSFNPKSHGVWRIPRGGVPKRLAGSRNMIQPNALVFDPWGNLYVTDSADGAVWRFPPGEKGTLWIRHPLLAPDPNFGIGSNGIAFVPPRNLFVANTDLALIARIRIKFDGSPGAPRVAAAGPELLTVDGLAADAHGNLHAVIAAASIFGTAPVVRVNSVTGKVSSSTREWASFDFPTSLAFGRGTRDNESIYVINSGLYPEIRPEAAPAVVRVKLRVRGAPLHLLQR